MNFVFLSHIHLATAATTQVLVFLPTWNTMSLLSKLLQVGFFFAGMSGCWSLLVAILLGWPERTWVRTELITIIKLGVALRRCSKSGEIYVPGSKLLILIYFGDGHPTFNDGNPFHANLLRHFFATSIVRRIACWASARWSCSTHRHACCRMVDVLGLGVFRKSKGFLMIPAWLVGYFPWYPPSLVVHRICFPSFFCWLIEKILGASSLESRCYHIDIPVFGNLGFLFMKQQIF